MRRPLRRALFLGIFYVMWYNEGNGPVAQWIERFRPKEMVARSTRARVTMSRNQRNPSGDFLMVSSKKKAWGNMEAGGNGIVLGRKCLTMNRVLLALMNMDKLT